MITLYELGPGGYWTGRTQQRADDQVIATGWTSRQPPANIPMGLHAVLTVAGWKLTEVPPPTYTPPAPVIRPELVITQISPDEIHAPRTLVHSLAEVTCPAGTELTFTAELRGPDGQLLPLTDNFRMPVRSRDGRERVVLASMSEGIVTIRVPLRESGVWSTSEEAVNSALPAGFQMQFAGVTVFAVEA